jgi:peptidoglycan hydrolase-like protein with peptidoglycan-binding domain
MKKTIFSAFLVFALVFSFGNPAHAQSNADQTLLQQLFAQVESLRMQLGGLVANTRIAPATTTAISTVKASEEVQPLSISATLRTNAMGPEVSRAQEILVKLGFLKEGTYTAGTYDRATFFAVQQFQSKHGLNVDGLLGASTARFMNQVLSESWGTSWGESVKKETPHNPVVLPAGGSSHFHLINHRIVTSPIVATSAASRIHTTVSCNNNERVLGGGYDIEINSGWKVMASKPLNSSEWYIRLYPGVSGDSLFDMASSMNMNQVDALNALLQGGIANAYAVCAEVEYSSGGSGVHF